MIRVHTLLAIWLTLAVPAAGVAAVAAVPDCAGHEATATSHEGHEGHVGHAGHPADPAPGAFQCDCPCGGLDCSIVLSLQVSPHIPDHGAPLGDWIEGAATAGVSTVAPDIPFRPPISI